VKPSTPSALSIQAEPGKSGPHVVGRIPLDGQRLDLSSPIQISFDQAMDREKTGQAWSFLGQDNIAVPGKISWLDNQTFKFAPDSKLEPSRVYRAIFSTSAAGLDGSTPNENLEQTSLPWKACK